MVTIHCLAHVFCQLLIASLVLFENSSGHQMSEWLFKKVPESLEKLLSDTLNEIIRILKIDKQIIFKKEIMIKLKDLFSYKRMKSNWIHVYSYSSSK